jgi:hypothetical protein
VRLRTIEELHSRESSAVLQIYEAQARRRVEQCDGIEERSIRNGFADDISIVRIECAIYRKHGSVNDPHGLSRPAGDIGSPGSGASEPQERAILSERADMEIMNL